MDNPATPTPTPTSPLPAFMRTDETPPPPSSPLPPASNPTLPSPVPTEAVPPPPPPAKKWGKGALVGSIAAIFLIVASVVTGLTLYNRRSQPVAPTAPQKSQAATDSLCQNGSFTTSGGFRFCFITDSSITTRSAADTACQQYGTLASFLDGETKQDVLDVISRFGQDKVDIYQGRTGADPDDGAYFADFCNAFTAHFGNGDLSLYWGNTEPAGTLNCSASRLSFGLSHNGLINDTAEGNGLGAVCELAPLASPSPSPSPSPAVSFQCQQVQVFRGVVQIQPVDIKLGDSIVFRGFATAVGTTISKLRFTLTLGGVAQTPVDESATIVGSTYQADYPVNVTTAASYSVTAVPISP